MTLTPCCRALLRISVSPSESTGVRIRTLIPSSSIFPICSTCLDTLRAGFLNMSRSPSASTL